MFKKGFQLNLFGAIALFVSIFAVSCDTAASKGANIKSSATATNSAPAQVLTTNRPKIVAFGDSLTAGFGLLEKESYPFLLQQKLDAAGHNYEVVNAGVSGDTSGGGLSRIDWSLNQPNVEILILELGANDILRGMSAETMKENLGEIIKRAKAKNVKVLFCGMYSPTNLGGERQTEIQAAFRDLAAEHKVTFLPFFLEKVGGVKTLNQADGIHPNAEGAKIITETIFKAVTPLLKK